MRIIVLIMSLVLTFFAAIYFFISLIRKKNISSTRFFTAAIRENQGPMRILSLGCYLWTFFFYLALALLLFVGIMCLFYTVALIHGEFYLQLGPLPVTAGNIAVHLVYPLEIFLFAIFVFVLFFGSIQIFVGPIEPFSKLALKVNGIGEMCRKLIGILVVILLLELTKTAVYSLLVRPELLDRFFAGEVLPLLRPGAMAGLVGASAAITGIVYSVLGQENQHES